MDRALGGMEHGIWRLDQAAPLNFTTTAHVRGPLSEALVRAALAAVRERHPLLRCRILPSGLGARFETAGAPPLSLEVVRAQGEGWVESLEHEVNTPIPGEVGPLARFVLVEAGPGEARLMVTLHHSIGDGMSGVFLIRDVLEAAAKVHLGQSPQLDALAPQRPVDSLLPTAARGLSVWWHHLRFVAAELAQVLRHGRPLRPRRDQLRFAYQRRARVVPVQLSQAQTEALAAKARAEGTTVHGALAAAMLEGLLADSGKSSAPVAFGSPVNVRSGLEPAVGDEVGFFVSMATFRGTVSQDTPFWELARQVRAQLTAMAARGDQLKMVDLMPRLFRLVGGDRLSPRRFAERWDRHIVATTGLTNLGRIDVETAFGPFELESCHFAVSPSAFGEFLATATTLRGRLWWNFIWTDPSFTQAHAEGLVKDIVSRLARAVEGPV